MRTLLAEIRPALAATAVLAAVTCAAYPLIVTGIAQSAFPKKADGSLITDSEGKVLGSALLAQSFSAEKYFHPRPSAAGAGWDAAASGGSNLGPTSAKLHDAIKERVVQYRTANGLAADTPVPADAVTASASGLDPHISPANAALQVERVARARNLSPDKVRELTAAATDGRDLGFLGEAGVNVLRLNLSLDALK